MTKDSENLMLHTSGISSHHRPTGTVSVNKGSEFEAVLRALMSMKQEQERQSRRLFDFSHPVSEEEWSDGPPAGNNVTIRPEYEIPVRYNALLAVIPIGATIAALRLDQRHIQLYNGPALTAIQVVNLRDLSISMDRGDERTLTFTGVLTSGFYIGLYGYTFERDAWIR